MKKVFKFLLLALFFISCQPRVEPADVVKINGYWEIQNVEFPDGSVKDFSMNESYDFFQIIDDKGFRQKVMPQFNGTFETNELQEKVTVVYEAEKIYLKYETPYLKWREELKLISDTALVLVNSDNKTYHYKKTEPVNLLGDGKKTQ